MGLALLGLMFLALVYGVAVHGSEINEVSDLFVLPLRLFLDVGETVLAHLS